MRQICAFLGSSSGARPEYAEAAAAVGREIASRGLGLVYGGARVGLMGAMANAALDAGGTVTGVIPRVVIEMGRAHEGITELISVETLQERKDIMTARADAFVVLPGGVGTMDEFFEVLTGVVLGIHDKPCGVLDVRGYYGHLAAFLDHMTAEGFMSEARRISLHVSESPGELLDLLCPREPVLENP